MLRVHLLETKELKKTENDDHVQQVSNVEFEVYAHINVGAQTYKSNSIVLGKGNHKWDFWCEILLDNYEQELQIVLCDSRNDDLLGRAALDLKSICHEGKTDMSPGPITRNKPDPFAVLSLGYKQEKTLAAMHTDDPVWKQGFTFLVQDPEIDKLSVKVMDQKTNMEIGSFVYHLLSVMEQEFMDIPCRPFHLMHSGPVSKINLAMQLRILKKWEGENHKDEPKRKTKAPPPPPPGSNRPLNASVRSEGAVRKISEKWKNKAMAGSSASLPALHFAPEGPARKTPVAKEELPTMTRAMKSVPAGMEQQVTAVHTRPVNAGKFYLGVIQLTLRYDVACFRLLVMVHKIVNLPLLDPKHMPSAYVKLHLLTERSRNSKRKTLTIKDDCNPVFNEIFDFTISEVELASRKLHVSVVTRNGIFSSTRPYTGNVIINLAKLDLKQGITHWFDICP
ncbi:hypothetical protein B566_EDAN004045 [Ephemera danica]|nr:hypothetical protein B566_EDAN004045 [Ephemera danica]